MGGEEFVAILPNAIPEAVVVAERIRAAFAAAGVEIGGHRMDATVSIGAAAAPARQANLQSLIERADAALYEAKRNGRNRVETASHPPPATRPIHADDIPMRVAA
jgi:diguanylate cyclase (GGDEF)-like protein